MAKTRAKASLDAKRIMEDLNNPYPDNPNLKYKWGWPAICALGRNYPDVAYKFYHHKKHGFVYDNRKHADPTTPVAKLVQINSLTYGIVVNNKTVCTKQTIGQCLNWIVTNLLGIIK